MKKLTVDGEELSLPTEKNEALSNLLDCSFLLYGEKKIGKTTLLTRFEDPFIFFFEPGGKFVETFNRHPKNWKQFKAYIKLLEAEPEQYRTIIVDTVDNCYRQCYKYICEKIGIEHPQDEDYGSGWQKISDEFTEQMTRLLTLGRGVVFVSHCEEREIEDEDGQKRPRIVPTMPKQARKILEAVVDIWACYKYHNKERVLYIRGTDTISAGHRLRNNFVGISKIPMGNSEEEAYKNLVAAFNTTRKPAVSSSPTKLKLKIG